MYVISTSHTPMPKNDLAPSFLRTKTLYELLFSPSVPHSPPFSFILIDHPKNTWLQVSVKKYGVTNITVLDW